MSLQPSTGGIFKVYLYDEEPGATENDDVTIEEYLLWDRKAESGFPGMILLSLPYFSSIALKQRYLPRQNFDSSKLFEDSLNLSAA